MQLTVSELESRLIPENRALVRRYVRNCNEEPYATILLSAFDRSEGLPISNAFYLHELTELELFRKKGFEFVDVSATPEFRKRRAEIYDSDREPHLTAAMLHCVYFQLKAKELGVDLSLGTVIDFDPLTSRQDKEDLFSKNVFLSVVQADVCVAEDFFKLLARAEKYIFDQPFSLANCDRYRGVIFG